MQYRSRSDLQQGGSVIVDNMYVALTSCQALFSAHYVINSQDPTNKNDLYFINWETKA